MRMPVKNLKPWTMWHRKLTELERKFESAAAFAQSGYLDDDRKAMAEGMAYGTVFLIAEMHYDGPPSEAATRREERA